VLDAEAVLSPVEKLDLKKLALTFTLRTADGFVENFGPALISRIGVEAPGVRLRFLQKPDRDALPLRDGAVDLETGVVRPATGPELRTHFLFRDRFVGVVRKGHPLSRAKITPARYVGGRHVDVSQHVSRHVPDAGPIDGALAKMGLEREIAIVVGGFSSALALARASDLIATVPERHTGNLRADMFSFALPIPTPEIRISMLWHPRLDADLAHRWLRGCVRDACAQQ
jgi:DNA-binding transcriptional LysR family regulator